MTQKSNVSIKIPINKKNKYQILFCIDLVFIHFLHSVAHTVSVRELYCGIRLNQSRPTFPLHKNQSINL